jgi:uncharacterized surface protein with fasciclin (FAS1) repeats
MNAFRTLAYLAIAGGLTAAAPGDAAAQSTQSCAQVLSANPNYRSFVQGFDRARAMAALNPTQPVTIFALDQSAIGQSPPGLRNAFRALGPEESASQEAGMIIDQLIVEGVHRIADLKQGQSLETLRDATVRVVGMQDGKPVLSIAGFNMVVVAPDQPCMNGMIQGITYVPRGR